MDRITTADPEYNTIYTVNFKENLFNKDLLGLSQSEVIKVLGPPFSITKLKYFDAVLYSDYKDRIYLTQNSMNIGFNSYSDTINYKLISFDRLGNVMRVMIKGYSDTEEEIKKLTKTTVLKKFGNPDKKMLCDCKCEVYSYSEIKEGSYSGKQPIINLRNIVFNDKNIAEKIVKKIKSTYSKYDEICIEE